MKFIESDRFKICGIYVETSLTEHNKDVSALYKRYFDSSIAERISAVTYDYGTEYYSVTWYTHGHERYPIASFPQGQDVYQAWTDFLNIILPNAGYTPDIDGNFIEYFPEGVNGRFEIWAPLVNADV